jgi:hypothetical protein
LVADDPTVEPVTASSGKRFDVVLVADCREGPCVVVCVVQFL